MIAHRTLAAVKATLVAAPPAVTVSSAVRGYDGGLRSGDVASVLPLSSGRTAIVVIDVAGHGSARAPLSTALADVMTASLRRDGSPALALNCAHQLLLASDDELPYAVAFVALVNPVFRTIVYASAGHDVAFTLGDGGRIQHLMQTAPMLGIPVANNAYDAVFVLDPRETLVIATDGISDSRPAGSEQFFGALGTAGAVTRSLFNGSDPAQAVLDAACVHAGGRQADDVAVLIARLAPVADIPEAPIASSLCQDIGCVRIAMETVCEIPPINTNDMMHRERDPEIGVILDSLGIDSSEPIFRSGLFILGTLRCFIPGLIRSIARPRAIDQGSS